MYPCITNLTSYLDIVVSERMPCVGLVCRIRCSLKSRHGNRHIHGWQVLQCCPGLIARIPDKVAGLVRWQSPRRLGGASSPGGGTSRRYTRQNCFAAGAPGVSRLKSVTSRPSLRPTLIE